MSPRNTTGSITNAIEKRLLALYEAVDETIFFIDLYGIIIDANQSAVAWISQYAPIQIGANIFGIMESHPFFTKILPELKRMVQEIVLNKTGISFEDEHAECVWRWVVKPVFSSEGGLNELCVIAQDVSHQILREATYRDIQSQFELIFENYHIAAWSADLRNHSVLRTLEHDRIFGYESLLPVWNYQIFLHHVLPEDRPMVEQSHHEIMERLTNWSSEYRIRRADGEVRHLLDIGGCMRDENGKAIRIQALTTDITEQKMMRLELHDLQHQWDYTLEKAHIGMWKLDFKTSLSVRTREHIRIFGDDVDSKEWSLQKFFSHVVPDDRNYVKQLVMDALAKQESYELECRILRNDGEIRWVKVHGTFLLDDEGKTRYLMGTKQDITEHKLVEIARAELEAHLQQSQKMELLGQLAGGIAHDVNNVLTSIQCNAELVIREISPTNPHYPYLETITKSVTRSADMVNQLLAFARKQPQCPIKMAVDKELERMQLLIRKLIRENITIRWKLQCPDTLVDLDPANLVQIITNLFVNARDAISEKGTITIETYLIDTIHCPVINRGCLDDDTRIKISVSDTGTGIDPQALPHIFEPFFTTKAIGKGTGLGLSTVYGLVKNNNGHIVCETEVGKGTTFTVCFPIASDGSSPLDNQKDVHHPEKIGKGTVLVVEDEPDIGKIIKMILETHGFTVLLSTTAEEALDLVRHQATDIDLIITDIMLPNMNGIEFRMKILKQNQKIKFLFMSGYSAEILDQYGKLGTDVNFISKPFAIPQFLTMVHEVLKKNA
ncbi:MAG: PAS domain-containing protein [Chlorobiaceae bacterium]|nr:PAS domain-containing protein [Chlorobiaceae bacterium]